MRASVHCCVPVIECHGLSPISRTEVLHRREQPYGCLLLDTCLVLLRGDLSKSFISPIPAEIRFRDPPPSYLYGSRPPDVVSYTPALRPNGRSFDGWTYSVRLIYVPPWCRWFDNRGHTYTGKGKSETSPGENCDTWMSEGWDSEMSLTLNINTYYFAFILQHLASTWFCKYQIDVETWASTV